MERTRRDVLGLAGVSVAALSAGCLDDTTPTADATGTPTDDTGETPGDDPDETPADDPDETPGNDTLPSDLERVDEPPYDISVPDCGEAPFEDGGRDPLYLCANMPADPSLSFTQATTRGRVLTDAGLELDDGQTGDELFVTLLTEESDRERVDDEAAGGVGELIAETDFGTHAVLLVETGWGSGSVYPHVKRVETTDDGVHAFGCHSDPCVVTSDLTSRTTAVRFERPDTLSAAVVSLTVGPDERWNGAAGEGPVSIP